MIDVTTQIFGPSDRTMTCHASPQNKMMIFANEKDLSFSCIQITIVAQGALRDGSQLLDFQDARTTCRYFSGHHTLSPMAYYFPFFSCHRTCRGGRSPLTWRWCTLVSPPTPSLPGESPRVDHFLHDVWSSAQNPKQTHAKQCSSRSCNLSGPSTRHRP